MPLTRGDGLGVQFKVAVKLEFADRILPGAEVINLPKQALTVNR